MENRSFRESLNNWPKIEARSRVMLEIALLKTRVRVALTICNICQFIIITFDTITNNATASGKHQLSLNRFTITGKKSTANFFPGMSPLTFDINIK